MPKLYFRYGVVSSSKTLNLLTVAHNYKKQGKKCIVMKPAIDTRFGAVVVKSRAGLEMEADVIIHESTNLLDVVPYSNVHCILVDECQFLEPIHVDQLRQITDNWGVPVICYGLRTNFMSNLFPASKRLFEVADSIEEIKTTCTYCNKKGTFNLKHVNGSAVNHGPDIQLGTEETYVPTCSTCYHSRVSVHTIRQKTKHL